MSRTNGESRTPKSDNVLLSFLYGRLATCAAMNDAALRFRRLSDAAAQKADILVRCLGCGRQLLFQRDTFLAILADKRVSDDRARAERKMTCDNCHRRGAVLALVPEGSPTALRLQEGAPLPPNGVSVSAWCAARSHETRRRLIRAARD